jgi:hypothetical protein
MRRRQHGHRIAPVDMDDDRLGKLLGRSVGIVRGPARAEVLPMVDRLVLDLVFVEELLQTRIDRHGKPPV